MAETTERPGSWAERANELYWSASMTVEDIAEDLGISRSSLYSALEPMPSGLVCADCHERMVFTNRTMRDRGSAICPNCGRESEPGEAGTEESAGAFGTEMNAAEGAREERDAGSDPGVSGWLDTLQRVPPQRVALIAGGAALGLLAGALATRLLRERI